MPRNPESDQAVRRARGMRPRPEALAAEVKLTRPNFITGERRREWNRCVRELAEMGWLSPLDRAVLSAHCVTWGDYVALTKEIDRLQEADGAPAAFTQRGSRGQSVLTALYRVQRNMLSDLQSTARDLGLTPSVRSRLPAPARRTPNALDELARRRDERRAKRRQSSPE
jgi:P27 family predicted phage terminase small subunit